MNRVYPLVDGMNSVPPLPNAHSYFRSPASEGCLHLEIDSIIGDLVTNSDPQITNRELADEVVI